MIDHKGLTGRIKTELAAGVGAALAVFPLALAFGASPFMGEASGFGLISAILAGVAALLLPGGGRLLAAPACVVYLVFAACAAQYGLALALLAAVLAGLLVFALSFGPTARLAAAVPLPVLAGLCVGLALVMTVLQTTNYFGIGATGEYPLQMLFRYQSGGFHPNWRTVLYGTITLVLMITYPRKFKRFSKLVPASFVSIVVTLLLNLWLNPVTADTTVVEIGSLWNSMAVLPALYSISFSVKMLGPLFLCTVAMAFAVFLLRAAPFSRYETDWSGCEKQRKQELRLAGICCAVVPLAGGMPVSAGPARGRSRASALFYTLSLLILLGISIACAGRLPVSTLAVILICTMWDEVDWGLVKTVFQKKSVGTTALFFICVATTLLLRLTWLLPVFTLIALAAFFRGVIGKRRAGDQHKKQE